MTDEQRQAVRVIFREPELKKRALSLRALMRGLQAMEVKLQEQLGRNALTGESAAMGVVLEKCQELQEFMAELASMPEVAKLIAEGLAAVILGKEK